MMHEVTRWMDGLVRGSPEPTSNKGVIKSNENLGGAETSFPGISFPSC